MKPIVIKNSKLPEALSWFMNIGGITLFPFIFIKGEGNPRLINHESIHIAQYSELFVLGFLALYLYDFVVGFARFRSFKEAYYNIRFEQEAYSNDTNLEYLDTREKFAWRKYKV